MPIKDQTYKKVPDPDLTPTTLQQINRNKVGFSILKAIEAGNDLSAPFK